MIKARKTVLLFFVTTLAICWSGAAGSAAADRTAIEVPDAETLPAVVRQGRTVSLKGIVYPKGHYAYFWFQSGPTTR